MTAGRSSPQVESSVPQPLETTRTTVLRSRWVCGWVGICLLWANLSSQRACLGDEGLLTTGLGASSAAQAPSDGSLECELRMVWGGAQTRPFEGSLSLERGTLKLVRNLNLQADAIATVVARDLKSLEILPASPTQFGGIDIRIRTDLDSSFNLKFKNPFSAEIVEHTIPVKQLLQGSWFEALDQRGTRIAIERLVPDRLRVEVNRKHTVFDTGETWPARISGYRTGLAAGEYELRTRMFSAQSVVGDERTRTVLMDSQGSFAAIDMELQTPTHEGAYLVEFSLIRRRFLNNLVSTGASLTRRFEFVAINPRGRDDQIIAWQPLVELDVLAASKPGSLAWLAPLQDLSETFGMRSVWEQVTPLTYSSRPPVSHGRLASRPVTVAGRETTLEVLTLAPNSWLALPLSGLASGKPHRLRVALPTDQPMELAVSVRSPDELGNMPALSRDAGFQIQPRECSVNGQLATHELIFWPMAGHNYVLLANTNSTLTASISTIDVEAALLTAPAVEGVRSQAGRKVGLYLDKPLLADSFSAPRSIDAVTKRSLDSWETWLTAAIRLEQTMDWTEADTFMLKVFSDGGGIFPSRHLEPSLRFDSGLFFNDGRSEELKDVVELLLRRFDREGKQLILALDVNTALPGLAGFEETQPSLLQRNLAGDTWPLKSPSPRPRVRRYNPLDSRVQAELTAIVREIADRYGHHPAFGGISLQLDQESQFIFAGDRWGLDANSLAKFAQAQQIKLPPAEQLEQLWSGPTRLAFLNWRAQELTKLFARLSQVVSAEHPDARLYLNALRLWEKSPAEDDFWQPAAIIRNPPEYMLAYGIDAEALEVLPRVTLMQGRLDRSWESVNAKDWILDLASARALQATRASGAAALVLQQPTGFQLAALEQLGNIAHSPSAGWVFPYSTAHDHYARKSLIHQIYDADPQLLVSGGWLPAGGQTASLQPLYRTLRELPAVEFADFPLPNTQSNLRVRSARHAGRTYLQLINNAPWSEKVTLQVESTREPSRLAARLLGKPIDALQVSKFPDEITRNSDKVWELQLPPYDLLAIEVQDPELSLQAVAHRSRKEVVPRISAELLRIEKIVSDAGDPTQQSRVADLIGDFEYWTSENRPRGWNVSSLPDVEISQSAELPRSGKLSMLIDNRQLGATAAWVQSEPITPPRTGRFTVQAWLRVPPAGERCSVRLSVVGRTRNGERFERYEDYGGRSETRAIANDWGRRPATLHVADVPTQELIELRVAIDVIGRGKVWVDDVEVFETLLHPDERIYLRGQVLVAKQNLENQNPFPAEQLLDSHWGQYLAAHKPAEPETARVANTVPLQTNERELQNKANWNSTKPVFQQWRESIRDRWKR